MIYFSLAIYGRRERDSRGRYKGHEYIDEMYGEYGRYEEGIGTTFIGGLSSSRTLNSLLTPGAGFYDVKHDVKITINYSRYYHCIYDIQNCT